jgi:hypothetical protein
MYACMICVDTHRARHLPQRESICGEFYTKMMSQADELATSGHPLGDEEFVSNILVGIDQDFDLMVSAVVAQVEPRMPAELYS